MFSIKKSKGNCEYCPLYDAPSCICETNSEDDLSQVRVLFIAENPGKNEIEQERPLVGVAGQVFRDPFNKFIFPTGVKYLITNAVLCATITEDGKTVNPDSKAIECCKPNVDFFIDICQPKLIVAMGQTIASVLGICETGITKFRSKFYKYKDYDVFLTVHPSYVNRNRSKELEPFRRDFITVAKYLGIYEEIVEQEIVSEGEAYYYKIPDRFYSYEYSLIDIQTNRADGSLIYIFRDSNNKKEIFKVPNAVNNYYYYNNTNRNGKLIEPYKNLSVRKCNYNEKFNLDPTTTYEGDLTLADKHAIDYYLQRKDEIKASNLNKLFIDIEVYSGKDRAFPQPNLAEYPINSISMKYNDNEIISLVLLNDEFHHSKPEIDNVLFFDSEQKLLSEFINQIRDIDPDVLTGWNFKYFDMMYISNRLKKLRMNPNRLSPFHYVVVDNFNFQVTGYVILDMLDLYKMFTYSGRESYTLDFISKLELGEQKVKYKYRDINQLYEENLELFIEYNRKDVDLVYELDKKLDHINFLNTVRESVHCCWKSAQTTMGQIDVMIVSHLKRKGLSVKNSQSQKKQDFAGAYVLQPEAGIYDYLIDLDFSSLYPNLIRTYNIGPNTLVAKIDELDATNYIYDRKVPDRINVVFDPLYNHNPVELSKDDFLDLVKDKIINITGCIYKRHEEEVSVFSEVLGFHIDRRKEYKSLMKKAIRESDTEKRKYYHTRQLAEKILVNASYGVLGNEKFRLFNVNLASSITSSGREAVRASAYAGTRYLANDDRVEKIPLVTEEDLERCKRECLIYMDTDSCFFDMSRWLYRVNPNTKPEEAKDKILKKVRDLENFLNKDFLIRFVEIHNITPKYSFLDLKQEVFAKRALFPGTKKKYALFITNREGEDVRELEIKGLDIKRSDYPAYTKKALQELIEIILYNDNINISDILNFQKIYTEQITKKIKDGDLDVCKPVSYSKPLSSYKRVPPHVEAMEWWNSIEYDYFVPGTKGYLYKLQGVDISLMPKEVKDRYQSLLAKLGKDSIDKIVVPIEQPSLPKYYVPDVKAMLDFAWTDRCKLLTGNLIQSVESSLLRF